MKLYTALAEWTDFGKNIKGVEGAIQWLIGDWLNYGETRYGDKYKAAIEATGYDYFTLSREKQLSRRFKEFRRRRLNLSWSHHVEVQGLEDDTADRLLDKAETNNWTVKELRKAVRDLKHHTIDEIIPLPPGEYNVILADPPWQYDFSKDSKDDIEVHYATMPTDEIAALKVPAAEQAVLFLWATAPKLREALEVMAAWGFEYKTNAVWDKEWIGMGYWFRGQHELLLVGTKGGMSPPSTDARYSSVIRQKREEHSAKPKIVYEIIEFMFPDAQRAELFAREEREGWTSWGNEVV